MINLKKIIKNSAGIVEIPFDFSMNTVGGNIKFSYVLTVEEYNAKDGNDELGWRIDWSRKMIHPDLEEGEEIRIDKKEGKRGQIFDRNGNGLAINGTISQVGIVPGNLNNKDGSKSQIAQILGVTVENIENKLNASYVKADMFVPIKDLAYSDIKKKNILEKIPGIMIKDKEARLYPLGEKACHLTGYLASISAEEYLKLKDNGYLESDTIGKMGLEKYYEEELRPKSGAEIFIINVEGEKRKVLANNKPLNGKDIITNIDIKLQEKIFDQLKDDAGAGIAMNPKTGEIYALVSTPTFNPNEFVVGISKENWNKLNNNKKLPLLSRYQKSFPPGSTFKPITAAIALNNSKLDPGEDKKIIGKTWTKGKSWGDYSITRISVYNQPSNLYNAMIYSDNIYFAQTALSIGTKLFESEALKFGLGDKVDFEIPLNNSQIASNGIKNEIQLADSGYGQGKVLMNIVQLTSIYTSFINDGNIVKPRLFNDTKQGYLKENVFDKKYADLIADLLEAVIKDPNGTGNEAFISGRRISGKTGTAETKLTKEDSGMEYGWFFAYDRMKPDVIVGMVIEDVQNRRGSHYVIPKVKEILSGLLK